MIVKKNQAKKIRKRKLKSQRKEKKEKATKKMKKRKRVTKAMIMSTIQLKSHTVNSAQFLTNFVPSSAKTSKHVKMP